MSRAVSCEICKEIATKKEKAKSTREAKKEKEAKSWEENPQKCARTKTAKDLKKVTKILTDVVDLINHHALVEEGAELRGKLVEFAQQLDSPSDVVHSD